ncbi:hypothetical protein EVAR_48999_1 [Eumeta japonica]|uniref:Uncharacterized protein n=1 Tax=Eumeta variegata TaxID=151549 RepID=A0A4C1YXU4_EUMVA|nr:hypothetical protein EVAR_48999_1 [Eumeta japonica]
MKFDRYRSFKTATGADPAFESGEVTGVIRWIRPCSLRGSTSNSVLEGCPAPSSATVSGNLAKPTTLIVRVPRLKCAHGILLLSLRRPSVYLCVLSFKACTV